MGDEEEHYPAREHWFTPAMATIIAVLFSLGITGLVGLTYTPLRQDIADLKREVENMRSDPAPKPETKVKMEAIEDKVSDVSRRLEKLEDRINALHSFLVQALPIPNTRPVPRRQDFEVVR